MTILDPTLKPDAATLPEPWPLLYPLIKQVLPWFCIDTKAPQGSLFIELGDGLLLKVVTRDKATLLVLFDKDPDSDVPTPELCRISCINDDVGNMTGFVLKARAESDLRTGRALPIRGQLALGGLFWSKMNEAHDTNPLKYSRGQQRIWQSSTKGKPPLWCWSRAGEPEAGEGYVRIEAAALAQHSTPF